MSDLVGNPKDWFSHNMAHINFVGLETLMLHAKFQDHQTSSSEEKDLWRFIQYIGMAAILVM